MTSHILPKFRMPIVSLSCILPLIILSFSPLLITPTQSHLTKSAIQFPSSSPTISVTDFGAVGNGHKYVVIAEQAENVWITGGGEINGQGLEFVKKYDERKNVMVSSNHTGACAGDECRPRLVGFIGCTNITISNINLFEPAYWWCVALSLSPSLWF